MIKQKMIEKEEELVCSMNHKLPIYMVVCDKNLQRNERLLCTECMENLKQNIYNVMSFKQVVQLIEENQKKKVECIENFIMSNIKQIEELQKILHQLKSYIIQQLDSLIGNISEWINNLQQTALQNFTYSFYEQLDTLINQTQTTQFNQKSFLDSIQIINHSWNKKIINKLNQFQKFELFKKSEQILNHIQNINQQTEMNLIQSQSNNQNNQQIEQQVKQHREKQFELQQQQQQQQSLQQLKKNKLQQFIPTKVKFNLINDYNKQGNLCIAIVFNNSGDIMISNEYSDILIWNFKQGRLSLSNRIMVHVDFVSCLVYSKKMNSFISGSFDKSIICWKQINTKEWKCSQSYIQHSDVVLCLKLNKEEDQLLSGGLDCQIKVWNVDFINNKLSYLYQLNNNKPVYSLSMNQSETLLASCAQDNFLLWKKGFQGKWELDCKQSVINGNQIYFINDHQFIWIAQEKKIDQVLIFELNDGIFKQNYNKTIQLIKQDQCENDLYGFPIIYNSDKNIILIRHKHHIYLITKVNNDGFQILGSLNSKTDRIFGTMTEDAQYLVIWDSRQKQYSSYQLFIE